MTKYKACCQMKCLVHGCEIKENGGCYCVCRLTDHIKTLENVIQGKTIAFGGGFQYIPADDYRQRVLDLMTTENIKEYENYRYVKAPEMIKKLQEKIKGYQNEP